MGWKNRRYCHICGKWVGYYDFINRNPENKYLSELYNDKEVIIHCQSCLWDFKMYNEFIIELDSFSSEPLFWNRNDLKIILENNQKYCINPKCNHPISRGFVINKLEKDLKINLEEAKKLWDNDIIQFYCCTCFKKEKIRKLYFDEKYSMTEIYLKLNIEYKTVKRIINEIKSETTNSRERICQFK